MVSDRAFIFYKCMKIICRKNYSSVARSLSSFKVKIKYQGQIKEKEKRYIAVTSALVFHKHILFLAVFFTAQHSRQKFLPLYIYFLLFFTFFCPCMERSGHTVLSLSVRLSVRLTAETLRENLT